MKTELIHWTSYLPHKAKFKHAGDIWNLTGIGRNSKGKYFLFGQYDLNDFTSERGFDMEECTLILHPLSDLTKETEHEGESCTLLDMINIQEYRDDPTENGRYPEREGRCLRVVNVWYAVLQLPYWKMEKFFEWHVDCFSLIENNLAIDINTL